MKKTIKLTEADLTKLVQESVKTVLREMNEISSDMIGRARDKFRDKYGLGGTERGNLEKDKYGNPLHPKDKKPIASHMRNFDVSYENRKNEENPIYQKAKELYKDVQWDNEEIEDIDGGYATGCVFGGVEDENGQIWEFTGSAGFNWEGDWELDSVEEVYYTAPNGEQGVL